MTKSTKKHYFSNSVYKWKDLKHQSEEQDSAACSVTKLSLYQSIYLTTVLTVYCNNQLQGGSFITSLITSLQSLAIHHREWPLPVGTSKTPQTWNSEPGQTFQVLWGLMATRAHQQVMINWKCLPSVDRMLLSALWIIEEQSVPHQSHS